MQTNDGSDSHDDIQNTNDPIESFVRNRELRSESELRRETKKAPVGDQVPDEILKHGNGETDGPNDQNRRRIFDEKRKCRSRKGEKALEKSEQLVPDLSVFDLQRSVDSKGPFEDQRNRKHKRFQNAEKQLIETFIDHRL